MNLKSNLFKCFVGALVLLGAHAAYAEDGVSTPSISPSSQSVSATVGQAIKSTSAYQASGFGGTVTYSVNPVLPTGLSLNASTGVVSGTPSAVSAQSTYKVTAIYGTKQAFATLQITVAAGSTSGGATISPSSQSLIGTVGKQITSTSPYKATGFTGTVTYSISPVLPQGLQFDASTGVISGTPSVVSGQANYAITAISGTTQASATVSIKIVQSTSGTTTGMNCPDPALAATETAAIQGRRAYLRLNCYGCHSDYGQGGTMGPNIQGAGGDVAEAVNGDGGMPSFTSALCPNDVTNLQAYLNGVKALQTAKTPQLLDWKTYPGNQFTTVAPGIAHFH